MTLVELMNAASRGYPLEEIYDHETGKYVPGRHGDPLAEFVVIEIADTYDPQATTEEQIGQAIKKIGNAQRELAGVVNKLSALLEERPSIPPDSRLWVYEFSERWAVPKEIDDLVASGFLKDESWHNDTMPLFTATLADGAVITLAVDAAEPEMREYETGQRFSVAVTEDNNSGIDEYLGERLPVYVYEGNDLNEAIAAIRTATDHPQTDEHLAGCAECMRQHDKHSE